MEFFPHSLSLLVSCLLFQIVNDFLKKEDEIKEWGGSRGEKKWKRRKRKETPNMSWVSFEFYNGATELNSN